MYHKLMHLPCLVSLTNIISNTLLGEGLKWSKYKELIENMGGIEINTIGDAEILAKMYLKLIQAVEDRKFCGDGELYDKNLILTANQLVHIPEGLPVAKKIIVDLLNIHWPSIHNFALLDKRLLLDAEIFDISMGQLLRMEDFSIHLMNLASLLMKTSDDPEVKATIVNIFLELKYNQAEKMNGSTLHTLDLALRNWEENNFNFYSSYAAMIRST